MEYSAGRKRAQQEAVRGVHQAECAVMDQVPDHDQADEGSVRCGTVWHGWKDR